MFRSSVAAALGAALLGVPAALQACEAHADAAIIKVQHNHGGHAGAAHAAPKAAIRAGALLIEAPWTRATPAGAKVAGGYMTIVNTGSAPDRLIGGTFPVAARFEVHEMAVNGGVMTMRELATGLEIPAGGKVELKPGGLHVMFMDLRQPLRQGEPIKGTLVFEKAGTVEIEYTVAPIGARSGGHTH